MADPDTPTVTLDTTLATRPAPRRKRAVPARVRIMGWLLLLVAVVSLSTTLVTRNLLLREVDRDVAPRWSRRPPSWTRCSPRA